MSYMAAELREADVGVPLTAAHCRGVQSRQKESQMKTEASGQREWMDWREQRCTLTKQGGTDLH